MEGVVTQMKKFRDLAVPGGDRRDCAAYQGRQLHIYAASGQAPAGARDTKCRTRHTPVSKPLDPALADAGGSLFQQNCAFCHGRDAGGGETGPDLTRSKLVAADVGGDKIGDVVLHGRPEKGMPAFNFSSEQIAEPRRLYPCASGTRPWRKAASRKGVDVFRSSDRQCRSRQGLFQWCGRLRNCHSPDRGPGRHRLPTTRVCSWKSGCSTPKA